MKSDQLGRVLSDDDLPTKLSIANEFKAFVKKNSVPRDLIHPYFLTLSRAIKSREDPQLTSVCFSCFCHLFKRVSIQDKQLLDDSATVAVVTDLLIDRLSDRSTGVRATANKVLLDYWVLVPQAVAVAMRQSAVVSSSHVTLGESLKWLQSVFDLSSAFNFSAFVQPVVDMLRYPQLQSSVCELLKKVYSVSDRRELEECLAATGVNEMLKKSILNGLPGGNSSSAVSDPKTTAPRSLSSQKSVASKPAQQPNSQEPGNENAPSSSLAFLNSLPNFRVDSLAPENVYSASDLESKINNMHVAFADKESEKNWSLREKHVTQIRKLLRGNALQDYPSQFAAAYKSVIDGVLKSATSLRTTLSNQGLLLVKESGQLGGNAFVDPVMDIVFPQIIRLTGQMKKITSNNAHITVCGLLTSATFSTKLINHVTSATVEKNAQPRTFAAVWLRILILSHSQTHKSAMQNHGGLDQIEKAIAKGLQDPTPSVKENMRVTYWSFAEYWPSEADKIYRKLDTKAKAMLDKVNPSGAKNAPIKKPAPRESLKEVMRRSRESSVNRDANAPSATAPPQRAKMGAPQRTSSGLVGRSLSGSNLTDRSNRLSSTSTSSRDQQRAVSDSTRPTQMTRPVSGRLSREPSLTRSSRDQSLTRSSRETVSREPSLTRGSRELPKQRVDQNRQRVPSISRDSRYGQRPVGSRESSRQSRESSLDPSRESSLAPSVHSSTAISRESSLPRDDLPSYDVEMDEDDPFVTQQLKLSLKQEDAMSQPEETMNEVTTAEATATTAPMEIPKSTPPRESTPPNSSPFVLAKSPATQGVSTSPATGKSASPPATAEDELSRDLNGESKHLKEVDDDNGSMDADERIESDVVMGDAEESAANFEPSEVEPAGVQLGLKSPKRETPTSALQGNEQAEPESHDAVADSQSHGADSADLQSEPRNVPVSPPTTSDASNVPILSPRPIHPAKFELDSDAMIVDEVAPEVNTVIDAQTQAEETPTEEIPAVVKVGFDAEAKSEPTEQTEAVKTSDTATEPGEPVDIPNSEQGPSTEPTELAKSAGSVEHVTEAIQEDPFGDALPAKQENGAKASDEIETDHTKSNNTESDGPVSAHDESEPMEICDSDNDAVDNGTNPDTKCQDQQDSTTPPMDFSSHDLKDELNTSSPESLTALLSNPDQYKEILDHVPAELFLLCVILFSESHVMDAQSVISRDTNLALSTASSMVMVCARDVYPSDSRWSQATVEELKHVTVTCLEWLTKLVNESSEASTLLATNKRYRTSLVHLLSTSVELHKQKFGDVTHNSLIHVIESMDKLSQRPPDKRTSRAFLEAPSPSPDSSLVEDVTDKLSHVTVKENLKTIRILPPQLASGQLIFPGSEVTWSKLELERLARSPSCSDSNEAILDAVSRDKVSVTQLSTLASRIPELEDVDLVTATILAYLHISHPPALTTAALVAIKQVLIKPELKLSMGHVTEIFSTLNHVNSHIDSRSPLAAAIEELVADLLTHTDSSEMLEFLLLSRSRDSKTQNKLLLLNTVYHVITPDLLPSYETQLLALITELISDPDPLVRRVTVGLVVRVLRVSPEMEGTISLAIKSKMDLVRYYMGA
ncbi:protein STU1 [Yarrowia lipolytica]|nr:protein STU1 [Yarrowia lipolytica]